MAVAAAGWEYVVRTAAGVWHMLQHQWWPPLRVGSSVHGCVLLQRQQLSWAEFCVGRAC
jgi:hypothetical protein